MAEYDLSCSYGFASVAVVGALPLKHVEEGEVQPDGEECEALADAYLHVDGEPLLDVAKGSHLSAEVGKEGGDGEVVVFVVIVDAEVYGEAYGGVACVVAVQEFAVDSACKSVGEHVAIAAVEVHVEGCEGAEAVAFEVCLYDASVAHELGSYAPVAILAVVLDVVEGACIAAFHIGKEVETEAAVGDIGHEGRVDGCERGVVGGEGDVFASEGKGVR